MNNTETILTVSSSLAVKSRSRVMARAAFEGLSKFTMIESRWLDLAEFDLQPYPTSEDDPVTNRMRKEFEAADGLILACPVYNWGPAASLTNFLHYVLDPENGRRYRPFLILAGAGTSKSHLAMDGLSRSILNEIHGIQIGPPIVGAGADVNRDSGCLAPALAERIENILEKLVRHTRTSAIRQPVQNAA